MSKTIVTAQRSLRGSKCDGPKVWPMMFVQMMFCAGDELPEHMQGKVIVPVKTGDDLCFVSGDTLPDDFKGQIFVDPATGKSVFNPLAKNPDCIYKPGDTLPSFDGFIEAFTQTGTVDLFGGDVIPDDVTGAVLFIDGTLCYQGYPAPLPEVQIDGDMPAEDSSIKAWFDCGIVKYQTDDGWIQVKPFGEKK